MSGTVGFFIVMALAFIYRYFTLEKLSSFIGIVFGLGFLGFSGGLLAILDQPTFGGALEILVVVIFTVWGANIGDKIAEKIPKRSGNTLISLGGGNKIFNVKLPTSDFILDMPGRKRISDSVKAELSEREFIVPSSVPAEKIPQWLKQRLVTDWGVGDAAIEVDKEGKVIHLAVAAKDEGLSSVLPKDKVALPLECKLIPFGLVAGDVVRIILGTGEVVEKAEVLGVNSSQNVVTIAANFDLMDKIVGKKAEFLVALPFINQKQKKVSVRRKSGTIEAFTAEKIYNYLREKGINDETAKNTVSKVEKRLLKIDGPISTELIKSVIIEEIERFSPDEAKKLRKGSFWKL
ncbi:MAG: hypothetical protein N3D85_07305 [Candidatus Bathyarchaeota archaeon]|nr:hypothetical protein [Candidatus Bathyarchaeota archaeon]